MVLNNLGFKRKASIFILVFSAIAPDFDYITRIWGVDVFLRYHRGITHGILALIIFPAIMGLIFRKKTGFFYTYFLSFIAYAMHLFLDLTNQYGTRILSPFDWNQYSLDLTFIIDPYITIGFLLSVIIASMNKKRSVFLTVCTLLIFIGYIAGRAYLQKETRQFLMTRVDANIYKIYPLPNDFLRWWFIARSGSEVKAGFVDLFTKKICIHDNYNIDFNNDAISRSKSSQVVQNFLYFARYPYAEVKEFDNKTVVTWKELSYSFMSGERFVAKVIFNKEGKIEKDYFSF